MFFSQQQQQIGIGSSGQTNCQSSDKWSRKQQISQIRPNVIKYERFANNLNKLDKTSAKTQIKFYQKTNKKMQSNVVRQRIDSLKPIPCIQFDSDQFLIQQKFKISLDRSRQLELDSSQKKSHRLYAPCIGLINPMYINVKSNLKRLANSSQIMKQKQQHKQVRSKNGNKLDKQNFTNKNLDYQLLSESDSPVKKQKQQQSLYFRIVQEMNEYFSSMKLASFKNNKTQFISRRNIKSQHQKKDVAGNRRQHWSKKSLFQDNEQNLNIIGLKPKNNACQNTNRDKPSNLKSVKCVFNKQQTQEQKTTSKFEQNKNLKPSFSQYNTVGHLDDNQFNRYNFINNGATSMIICNDIYSNPAKRFKDKKVSLSTRPLTQQIKNRSPIKKLGVYKGFCFGQINLPKNTNQQVYRLKILYYKDLLWKNSFNQGLRYLPAKKYNQEPTNLKYFVGKGNNSKLIKNIMSKRWWWSLDSKQQNSQFAWTQLNIHTIYQKQSQLFQVVGNPQIQDQTSKQAKLNQLCRIDASQRMTKQFLDNSSMILNSEKLSLWDAYISNRQNLERERKACEQNIDGIRKRLLNKCKSLEYLQSPPKMTNHLEFSKAIGNKKALYKVMMLYFTKVKRYSEDQIFVPLTYHITAGLQDQQYLRFLAEYYRRNKNMSKTCWIVKPGELTNRGRGIKYCRDLNEIKPIVKQKQTHPNGSLKTFLIQQYLDRPLLYKGRKFDIRHYIMISSINGKIRGYFYQGGYIRTTSYRYKLDDNSPAIHLTNDAVQKCCKDYGKYEKGNKLSYEDLNEYIKLTQPTAGQHTKITFFDTIHPQIKKISTDVIHAASYFIDPKRKINNFQIYGLDIMVDENFKCHLIEVNTNPCLQLSSLVLKNVIPEMLDYALALTLDCCYPPPQKEILHQYHKKFKYPISTQNKFQLVFDEDIDGKYIKNIYKKLNIEPNQMSGVGEDDQNFQSCQEDEYDS